ncbi:MAG: hypothetical protein JW768_00025 [Chitinispirillaceae bacterium]|nr:hypothetical protein [Chitinispirillaceae bacterium]
MSIAKNSAGVSAIAAMMLTFSGFGQEAEKEVNITGYSSYSFGQVVQGNDNQPTAMTNVDHYWSHEVYTGLGFKAVLNENFTINASVEGKMWQPYPANETRWFKLRNYSLWLDQGNATYAFGDVEQPWLSMTMGYFKYKYNPEARNLGEQMFRSLAYPGIIINYFDFPANRLLGYKAHFSLLEDNLKIDAMLISESDWYPFGDFSPALVGSYKVLGFVEIGGGVELARLLSTNSKKTTPEKPGNMVVTGIDTTTNMVVFDSSSYYTFKAVKLMGRVTLDPKALVEVPFLGSNDGKIYGEINVLGVENQLFYYEDISQRMPISFGVYVPTFKILDVLAFEAEYYTSPFQTGYKELVETASLPLPEDANRAADWFNDDKGASYKYDDWKWSVYAKKTLIPGFTITGQIARDHMRTTYADGLLNYTEATARPGQWYWIMKLGYNL